MCPACIGSTFLLLSGAGSAGGLALIAARVLRAMPPAMRSEDSENPNPPADQELLVDETGTHERG